LYTVIINPDVFDTLDTLSKDIIDRVWKKLNRLQEDKQRRHLEFGCDFFVEEVGQYRIGYKVFENEKIIKIYFIGKHKDYEKWYKQSKSW